MDGNCESGESRLLHFGWIENQTKMENQRNNNEVLRFEQGREQRRKKLVDDINMVNELVKELNKRIQEIEAKKGNASHYREIAKQLSELSSKQRETFMQTEQRAGDEISEAVAKREWKSPEGNIYYDFKGIESRVAAAHYWFAVEDQILDRLSQMLMEYTNQAKGAEGQMQTEAARLRSQTEKARDSAGRFKETVFEERGVKAAESKLTTAQENKKRVEKEMEGKDLAELKRRSNDAATAFDKANGEMKKAQDDAKTKQDALDRAQKTQKEVESQHEKMKQLDEEVKTLESSVAEKQGQQTKLGTERNAAETEMTQKNAAIDVQVAKDIVTVGSLGVPPDPAKKRLVEAFEARAVADKAKNKEEKDTKQRVIDQKFAQLGNEIISLNTQITQKKEEKRKISDVLPAGSSPDLEKLNKDLSGAKSTEENKKAETAKSRKTADDAKKKYDDANKPLVAAQAKLDAAEKQLEEAKALQRKVTEDEQMSYKSEADKAVKAIEEEGSMLFKHFSPQQKLMWTEKVKAKDGKEKEVKRSTTVQLRTLELLRQRTDILDDLVDREKEPELEEIQKVLDAISAEQNSVQKNLATKNAQGRMGQLLTLDRKWQAKKAECIKRQAEILAPALRAETDKAWREIYDDKGKRRDKVTTEQIQIALDAVRAEGSNLFKSRSLLSPKLKERMNELKGAQSRLVRDRQEVGDMLFKQELTEKLVTLQSITDEFWQQADRADASLQTITQALKAVSTEGTLLRKGKNKNLLTPEQDQRLDELLKRFKKLKSAKERIDSLRRQAEQATKESLDADRQQKAIKDEQQKFEKAVHDLNEIHENVQRLDQSVKEMNADARAEFLADNLPEFRRGLEALKKRKADWNDTNSENNKKFEEADEILTRYEHAIDPLSASEQFNQTQSAMKNFLSEIQKTEGSQDMEAARNSLFYLNKFFWEYRALRNSEMKGTERPNLADQQALEWVEQVNRYLPTTQFYKDYQFTFGVDRDQSFQLEKRK